MSAAGPVRSTGGGAAVGAAGGVPAAARPPVASGMPGPGGLASAQAPPFRLPGEHFAAALGFWLLGSLGLVAVAPHLALGLFPLSRVVATTHLFTLGWITTSILGALYQFLPVALGTPIRSERLAHITFWLYVPGLALFVGGLAAGAHTPLLAGAALFTTGLLLFLGNLAMTLARARTRDVTWWALAGAGVFLFVTIALGLTLAGNLRWGYLGAHRFLALGVHLHVAIAGWVLLVVVGVAHRLLPMFLLSHGASGRPAVAAVALLAGGVGLLAAWHLTARWGILVPALLIGAGAAAFLLQAALFFRHRIKPKLDPGLRLAGVALAFLALALAMAPFALARGLAAPRLGVAYVTALVLGGLTLFVAGIYYKVVPFLVWYHRFGPLAGKRPVPRVAELFGARPAHAAGALLAAGALGLIIATLAGAPGAARLAAVAFAGGAATEVLQMFHIARRRPG
ncbi:MAG TPA: hypothetical protein VF188_04870 [Longimicrobiales bacterium]